MTISDGKSQSTTNLTGLQLQEYSLHQGLAVENPPVVQNVHSEPNVTRTQLEPAYSSKIQPSIAGYPLTLPQASPVYPSPGTLSQHTIQSYSQQPTQINFDFSQLANPVDPSPNFPKELFDLGVKYLNDHEVKPTIFGWNLDRAKFYFNQALKMAKGDLRNQILLYLGKTCIAKGNKCYQDVSQVIPKGAFSGQLQSSTISLISQYKNAAKEAIYYLLQCKLESAEDKKSKYYCLSEGYSLLGDHENSLSSLNISIEFDPGNLRYRRVKVSLLSCLSRNAEAFDELIGIIKKSPGNHKDYENLLLLSSKSSNSIQKYQAINLTLERVNHLQKESQEVGQSPLKQALSLLSLLEKFKATELLPSIALKSYKIFICLGDLNKAHQAFKHFLSANEKVKVDSLRESTSSVQRKVGIHLTNLIDDNVPYISTREIKDTLTILEKHQKLTSIENTSILITKGKAYTYINEYQNAFNCFKKAWELFTQEGSDTSNLNASFYYLIDYIYQGYLKYFAKDEEKAISILRIHTDICKQYLALKKATSEQLCDAQVVALPPKVISPEDLVMSAKKMFDGPNPDYSAIIELLNKASSFSKEAMYLLTQSLLKIGRVNEALETLESALKIYPDDLLLNSTNDEVNKAKERVEITTDPVLTQIEEQIVKSPLKAAPDDSLLNFPNDEAKDDTAITTDQVVIQEKDPSVKSVIEDLVEVYSSFDDTQKTFVNRLLEKLSAISEGLIKKVQDADTFKSDLRQLKQHFKKFKRHLTFPLHLNLVKTMLSEVTEVYSEAWDINAELTEVTTKYYFDKLFRLVLDKDAMILSGITSDPLEEIGKTHPHLFKILSNSLFQEDQEDIDLGRNITTEALYETYLELIILSLRAHRFSPSKSIEKPRHDKPRRHTIFYLKIRTDGIHLSPQYAYEGKDGFIKQLSIIDSKKYKSEQLKLITQHLPKDSFQTVGSNLVIPTSEVSNLEKAILSSPKIFIIGKNPNKSSEGIDSTETFSNIGITRKYMLDLINYYVPKVASKAIPAEPNIVITHEPCTKAVPKQLQSQENTRKRPLTDNIHEKNTRSKKQKVTSDSSVDQVYKSPDYTEYASANPMEMLPAPSFALTKENGTRPPPSRRRWQGDLRGARRSNYSIEIDRDGWSSMDPRYYANIRSTEDPMWMLHIQHQKISQLKNLIQQFNLNKKVDPKKKDSLQKELLREELKLKELTAEYYKRKRQMDKN